ncbi:MAG: hypothetical protein Q9193_002916 [Seirophora villosa]
MAPRNVRPFRSIVWDRVPDDAELAVGVETVDDGNPPLESVQVFDNTTIDRLPSAVVDDDSEWPQGIVLQGVEFEQNDAPDEVQYNPSPSASAGDNLEWSPEFPPRSLEFEEIEDDQDELQQPSVMMKASSVIDVDSSSDQEDASSDLYDMVRHSKLHLHLLMLAQDWVPAVVNMPSEVAPKATYLLDLSDSDSDSDADIQPDSDIKAHRNVPSTSLSTPSSSKPSSGASSRASSRASSVEVIHPLPTDRPLPPIHLALGLWAEKSAISRQNYARLKQVFSLVTDHPLPTKLDTLKRLVRHRIPMLRMMRKAIEVTIQKQASFGRTEKKKSIVRKTSWMYWFDPIDLVHNILKATKLKQQMHFGMAEYHDQPTELWHAKAWGTSIRATSGDVILDDQGLLLIPGDIVIFGGERYYTKGRIVFIGRDFRQTTDQQFHGWVVVTVQATVFWRELTDNLQSMELYLIEDEELEIILSAITGHPDVLIDREFGNENNDGEIITEEGRPFIRRVLNVGSGTCRLVRQLHPVSGELEIEEFGRDHLQQAFCSNTTVYSVPFSLFIDDFGIHRNSYRALKAFYWIPSALPYNERRKLANVFTLTLGPHGASIDDVVEAFYRDFRALDRGGYSLEVGGEESLSRRYLQHLTGQQAARFTRDTGIRQSSPAVAKLTPALDLILKVGSQRWNPADYVHEWLLEARKCYQMLVQCAEDAGGEQPSRRAETDAGPSTGLSVAAGLPGPEQVIEQVIAEVDAEDTDRDEASDVENGGDESDLGVAVDKKGKGPAATKSKRKRGRPRGQMTKYQKLLGLPNVHAGLYIADVAREYATVMNCNLVIERDIVEDKDEDDVQIQGDDKHVDIRMTLGNFVIALRRNTYNLRPKMDLQKLDYDDVFIHDLISAYSLDYGIRRIEVRQERVIKDPVLDLYVLHVERYQRLYGLPALLNEILYCVPANPNSIWLAEAGVDEDMDYEQEYFLECDWGVDYL